MLLEWVCWSVNISISCLVVSVFANFYQTSTASKNGLLKTARRLIWLSSTNSVRVMVEIADYLRMTLLYYYWVLMRAWEPTKTTDNTTSLHFLALLYFKITQWTTNLLCIMYRVWKDRSNTTSQCSSFNVRMSMILQENYQAIVTAVSRQGWSAMKCLLVPTTATSTN
jgi:hypothetical protein